MTTGVVSLGKTRNRRAKKPKPPSAAGTARMSSGITITAGDSPLRRRVIAARLAEEHDHDEPRHVERGQECGESAEQENREVLLVSQRQDRVLAEKSAERRTADQRERADEKGQESERHLLP